MNWLDRPMPKAKEKKPMTKAIEQELLAAFQNSTSDTDSEGTKWFPIWSEKINEWLCHNLPLYTDAERVHFNIENKFRVYFDWKLQVWRVAA